MKCDVRIGRVRIETLTRDQHRLPMVDRAFAFKFHISRDHEVSGNLLPRKLEGIDRAPHIRAASRDPIRFASWIKYNRSLTRSVPNVGVPFEQPNPHGLLS